MANSFPSTIRSGPIALVLWLCADMALAEPLAEPQGPVILTVSGQIDRTNGGGVARLDRALLVAMGSDRIVTSTPWTTGVHHFDGVPLASVLIALGATGAVVQVTGLNDYTIDIPRSEIGVRAPLLAFQSNGVALSPRDKGPVWVIYPFDEGGAYQHDITYARSVWQLVEIEVLP